MCSALLLSAVALFAAWAYASLQPWAATGRGLYYFYVTDEYLAVAFGVCGFVWFFALTWVWRGATRSRPFIAPAVHTAGVLLAAMVGGVVIDEFVRGDRETVPAQVQEPSQRTLTPPLRSGL